MRECHLHSDKVRDSNERDADCDKNKGAGNKVREHHECQTADQWDYRPLLLAVHKKAQPN